MGRGVGEGGRDWGVRSEMLGLRWHVGIGCQDWGVMTWVLRLRCWEQGVGNGALEVGCQELPLCAQV